MTDFDPALARRAAELANLAYLSEPELRGRLERFEFFEEGDTQALVVPERETEFLAFRGTEPRSWEDWKTDLQIARVPYRLGTLRAGRIHSGFKRALEGLAPRLEQALQRRDRSVLVTGHSLGGALSVLWAAACSDRPARVAGVYTFGAPRVGNRAFARAYDRLYGDRTFQFHNRLDHVARVPNQLFWRHVGQRLYFDAEGRLIRNPRDWWVRFVDARANYRRRKVHPDAWIGDHAMVEYLQRLATL